MKANRKIARKTKECLQVRNDILKIEKKEFHIGQAKLVEYTGRL